MLIAYLAQTATPTDAAEPSSLGGLIILLPFAALFIWMMRKQGKQRREHMELVNAVQVGDEVETVAGMYGRVTRTEDAVLFVEFSPGAEFKIARASVRRRVPATDGS